jgi:hypothetical protein
MSSDWNSGQAAAFCRARSYAVIEDTLDPIKRSEDCDNAPNNGDLVWRYPYFQQRPVRASTANHERVSLVRCQDGLR